MQRTRKLIYPGKRMDSNNGSNTPNTGRRLHLGNRQPRRMSAILVSLMVLVGAYIVISMFLAPYGGDPYSMHVSREEYGERWPLNVNDARLGCDQGDIAYIAVGDRKYALNVRALETGLPRPDPILAKPGEADTANFMERVARLCQTRSQVSVDPKSKSDMQGL